MALLNDARKHKRHSAVTHVLEHQDIDYFSATELFKLSDDAWDYGRFYPPPTGMASNIAETVKLADEIRRRWGDYVFVVSGYRPPVYNDLLRNRDNEHMASEDSQHLYFRALDLRPVNPQTGDYSEWRRHVKMVVEEWRRGQDIATGCGMYESFVHIDCGRYSYDRSWPNNGRLAYSRIEAQ